jgi:hypothetical protein
MYPADFGLQTHVKKGTWVIRTKRGRPVGGG